VTCDQGDNTGSVQLKGVGIITIDEHCRAHTPQVVLTPNRHLKSTQYLDFLPPVDISTSVKIPTLNSTKLNNLLTHQNPIVKLTDISEFSKTIEELETVIQEEKDKTSLQLTSGTHTTIIIILSTVLGILLIYNLFKIYLNRRRYFGHRVVPRIEVTSL